MIGCMYVEKFFDVFLILVFFIKFIQLSKLVSNWQLFNFMYIYIIEKEIINKFILCIFFDGML